MKDPTTFHLVTVTIAIEQRAEGEARAVQELASVAVEAGCRLLAHVSGREVKVKVLQVEPIRLIEPGRKGDL
jgi:hypothetical protein